MLIVIGIISLLIAILIPALNKTKQQAQRILCTSNLRSLHLAAFTYAMEHNDYLPTKQMGMDMHQQYLCLQDEVDSGYPDIRKIFCKYLDHPDGYNKPAKIMYCPASKSINDQVRKTLSYENSQKQWQNGIYNIGYMYWAINEDCLDAIEWDWYSDFSPVYKTTAKGSTPIFSDPLEKHHFSPSPWPWGIASHTKNGTSEYSYKDPEGQNNAMLDGSVIFYKFENNDNWIEEHNTFGELEAAANLNGDGNILLLWGGVK